MYSILASPLRKLFNDQVQQRDRVDPGRRRRGAKDRWEDARETNERTEIILNILKLYRTDPMLAIVVSHDFNQPLCAEKTRQ